MKKSLILLALIVIASVSCSDTKLINDAEKFLKSQLNDPKSYERITFTKELTIPVFIKERLDIKNNIINCKKEITDFEEEISNHSKYLNEYPEELKPQVIQRIAERKKTIDSLNVIIAQYRQDSIKIYNKPEDNRIHSIVFRAEYRARNSFNALIVGKSTVIYYPQTKEYEIFDIPNY